MAWLGTLLDTVVGGLPAAAVALCPEHLKRQWLERLADNNPFATISDNHDLVRATRLAWIEAAQDVLKAVRARQSDPEWHAQNASVSAFDDTIRDILLDARDHALDRRKAPGRSPIDAHVEAVIAGVPEHVRPDEHTARGASVSADFTETLAALSGWTVREIPSIYRDIAERGLAPLGGGPARPFGELVFAAFAEIIKDPRKYPQAREAFHLAIGELGRDLGRKTLDTVRGLDDRLEALTTKLDGLEVLRAGAIRHLELVPQIAEDVAATRDRVDANSEKLDEIIRRMARAEGVPLDALRAILADMGEAADALDAGQIEERLRAKAGEFKALTDRLNRLSNDDPEVRRLRHAAAEALSMGRFAQADAHLAAAEERDLAGLEDLEALAKRKRLSAAESRAERAAAAKLRTSPDGYREAANHYGEAAKIAAPADPGISREYARRKGMALIDLGAEFGRNDALLEAIDHFRAMTSTVDRNDDPLEWASIQVDLGNALMRLGERENGTARLEEAVAAHRAALEERRRDRVPFDWAVTQANLGITLSRLGERDGEHGIARLEEAVEAYRAALEEFRQDAVPLQWAMTQANLGTTLMRLGQRESGTARLQEAITAFRAALREQTRDRIPLEWARTQTNLGLTLFMLGERENKMARLKEALVALNAALEERRQDRAPLDWANTLCLAGDVLRTIADHEHDLILAQVALRQIEETRPIFQAIGNSYERAYQAEQSRAARELVERLRRG